jgi:tRNA A37 threonylcarbamoyltransferase TsaD
MRRGGVRQGGEAAGLGYPGGPAIDRVAATGQRSRLRFSAARLTHADRNAPGRPADGILPADIARRIDFSFSG